MKLPKKSVQIPQRNLALSDVRRWQHYFIVGGRRFSGWCRDFYLHRTIWLEIALLMVMTLVSGWLLYHFLYAQPQETLPVVESSLKLDASRIETLQSWAQTRQRAANTEIRVPEIVFGKSL